ncbi:TOBE domain-containing protein [Paenalcaligenes niemegkensis]|uniref:TOBE domain-containing protein n=1 Tax=Paenalcaligenes niemegkensis TaxID=2895469 RepID=UPI001EE84BFC|nr:TOBE domain-containing protein [Paenalcaligenes niemegkensis]MCQ9616374.1 TOBE domain-containing protein [Paenalcaligenes niemegkensis]
MMISTRNQFQGKVKAIHGGAVNDEIVVGVASGREIVAIITESSTKNLALTEGSDVVVLVKASSIILATDIQGLVFSARNQISGVVAVVTQGAVNSEVVIDAGNDLQISAIITNVSFDNLGLKVGAAVTAIFKASSVIIAAKA